MKLSPINLWERIANKLWLPDWAVLPIEIAIFILFLIGLSHYIGGWAESVDAQKLRDAQELVTKHCRASKIMREYIVFVCDNGEELTRQWQ